MDEDIFAHWLSYIPDTVGEDKAGDCLNTLTLAIDVAPAEPPMGLWFSQSPLIGLLFWLLRMYVGVDWLIPIRYNFRAH